MTRREMYPAPILGAMDEIAVLLHVVLATRGMWKTWKNADAHDARGLRVEKARPKARAIIKGGSAAAADLLEAALSNREDDIVAARAKHASKLQQLVAAAAALVKAEYDAFPEVAGRGVFDLSVYRPLSEISHRWGAGGR